MEASLAYRASSKTAGAIQRNIVLKKEKKRKTNQPKKSCIIMPGQLFCFRPLSFHLLLEQCCYEHSHAGRALCGYIFSTIAKSHGNSLYLIFLSLNFHCKIHNDGSHLNIRNLKHYAFFLVRLVVCNS